MKRAYIIIGIIVVVLLLAAVAYMYSVYRTAQQENTELRTNFEQDKEDLKQEYEDFANQYAELQLTIRDDSLSERLAVEKEKVRKLQEELSTVKTTNATEIRRLKDELALLRKIMMGYVQQIDSLNRENQGLREQTQEITQRYNQATAAISTLSDEKQTLSEKVSLAAQLNATGIALMPKNKKGRAANKVKDITQFQIDFTIARNVTAETGTRTVYIRLVQPGNVLLTRGGGTFPYENRNLPYSIKKTIEYNGEATPITVYWEVEEYLEAGQYRVDIFADSQLIGSNTFNVK